jgi:hypothetical protein
MRVFWLFSTVTFLIFAGFLIDTKLGSELFIANRIVDPYEDECMCDPPSWQKPAVIPAAVRTSATRHTTETGPNNATMLLCGIVAAIMFSIWIASGALMYAGERIVAIWPKKKQPEPPSITHHSRW